MMKYLIAGFLMWNLIACTTEQNTGDITTNGAVLTNETGDVTQKTPSPKFENDLAKKNLNGKIESREVLVYEALIKEGYVTNGAWKYTYDASNNLLEGNYSDENVRRKVSYNYDDKNQLTSSDESVNEKLVKQTTYVYDANGNEIGNEASFVESNGKSRSEHAYDEKGQLRETNIYDEKDALQLKQLYTYNEAGQEIQQSIFTGDNAPSYKRKSEYDAKGNKTKDAAFTGDGVVNPSDTYKYKYEYDENKNWATQIRSNYNDVADQFIEQKIAYYE
jgi:hypothetical protein